MQTGSRRWQWVVLCWVVFLAGAPAWAMNKCTGIDGKVTYQDDACTSGKTEKPDIQHYRQPLAGPAAPAPAVVATPSVAPALAPAQAPASPRSRTATPPPGDGVVHVGPRGGRYILLPSGKKRYLPKES